MKEALIDLFTSKKFLAALTAIIVYVAGRFGFDVDTAVLDRIFAALLVYIGAQGVADHGKEAAKISAAADNARAAAFAASVPAGLETDAAIRVAPTIVLALVVLGLAGSSSSCTPAQRTATGHALVDCTAANGGAIGATASSMRGDCKTPAGGTDWDCVTSKAIALGVAIGGCAFLEVLSPPAPAGVAAVAELPPDPAGTQAFERYRARIAGGATYRTAAGER